MTIVCDSSALITLALVNRLSLLEQLFGKVHIPRGVYEEVVVRGAGKAGADAVRGASFIEVAELAQDQETPASADPSLSRVDAEVIALAKARGADLVVTRDRRLVRRLRQQGIAAVTMGEVFITAKKRGHVESVKVILDDLKQKGVLIRDATYRALLQQVGEHILITRETRTVSIKQ